MDQLLSWEIDPEDLALFGSTHYIGAMNGDVRGGFDTAGKGSREHIILIVEEKEEEEEEGISPFVIILPIMIVLILAAVAVVLFLILKGKKNEEPEEGEEEEEGEDNIKPPGPGPVPNYPPGHPALKINNTPPQRGPSSPISQNTTMPQQQQGTGVVSGQVPIQQNATGVQQQRQ
jgi:hypothetical protein